MTSSKPQHWEPCYTDPFEGLAMFDGLIARTDTMMSPRDDRVIPIFEEEQVLMCRYMHPLLNQVESPHVLDIGTGSGVLAIYAALNGAKAIGIDITKRSMDFARWNAEANGVNVHDSVEPLLRSDTAGVHFVKVDIENYTSREDYPTEFDFILINPPYNPTFPALKPAKHAFAGPDGQDTFRAWIPYVHALLKEGGVCIGHQLSLVNDSNLSVLYEVEEAFSGNCDINYAYALNEYQDHQRIPCEQFLTELYGTLVETGQINRQAFKSYVQELAGRIDGFALIYYEVIKRASGKGETTHLVDVPRPNRRWEDRVRLHKLVVENIT